MTKQVLSILSHVVHGYVGNRAITFPLQYLGWNVDALNTTNLSNHPGYGKFGGSAESPELIKKVLQGLKDINQSMVQYDMLITGYCPNADILTSVKESVFKALEQSDHRPIYIMDPILGDNGKLYVPEAVIPIYKEILSSGYVDLITPNQFEFETFSGVKISNKSDLITAISNFNNNYKVKNIIISSITLEGKMYSVGFTRETGQYIFIPIDEIPCKFFGCGDLFTALISHNFYQDSALTPQGLQDAIVKLTKILQHTKQIETDKNGPVEIIYDIKIIPSRHFLLQSYRSPLNSIQI